MIVCVDASAYLQFWGVVAHPKVLSSRNNDGSKVQHTLGSGFVLVIISAVLVSPQRESNLASGSIFDNAKHGIHIMSVKNKSTHAKV